ncbi:MAG: CDP-diacylglycerol--serine O-phosphatidyltransferase [Desulfobaccales bacterium]
MSFKRRRKKKDRRKFRGTYLIPNLITTASLFSGFFAIVASINGRFEAAALAVLVAMVLDGLDGRLARLTQTTSGFGVQYDSLSDLVAFGVAPALLVYLWALKEFGRFGWVAAFLFVACGALRLARFNVQTGSIDPRYFNGLPIPAAAAFAATGVLFYLTLGDWTHLRHVYVLVMIYVLSFLMVSNIKFYSFKKLDMFKRHPFQTLVALVLIFVVVATEPYIMGFILAAAYVLSGIFSTYYYYSRPPVPEKTEEDIASPKPSNP